MSLSSIDNQALPLIEEHVRRLLIMMNIGEVTVASKVEADNLLISVEAGDNGRLLIGPQGTHLLALQHVIRCLLRSQLKEAIRVTVDVNGYRSRREQSLLHLAKEVARRAQHTGRTIALRPMSAADRRAVHNALSTQKDVRTESLGDEPNRRVVVRPVFL